MVEFTAATPFETQLRAMAETGLFISVHTSNLANAQFLQPGSAVIEIIQRNWVWHNLDRSFQVWPVVLCCPAGVDAIAMHGCQGWLIVLGQDIQARVLP